MKKIVLFIMLAIGFCTMGLAQTEVKVKPTSSVPQKVHNAFSKHKHHNGYKSKVKHGHHKHKHKHKNGMDKNTMKND